MTATPTPGNPVAIGKSLLHDLIASAIRAPSGDNCQPWKFEFESPDKLRIYIVQERAKSFFDLDHSATFLSVGAVLENLRIEAAFQGFDLNISYLGGDDFESPAAAITLQSASQPAGGNATNHQAMLDRTVNRRPYFRGKPSPKSAGALTANPVTDTDTTLFTDRSDIKQWARLIYLADRIRYSHPNIHQELFGKILLSRKQINQKRMGLEFDRLGIGPGSTGILKLLKPWNRMQRLSKFGVAAALSNQARMLTSNSGAIALVTIPDKQPENWMRSGEQVERLWVKAQELGICVHPMTVALYLSQRYQSEGMANFLPQHEAWLKEISAGLKPFLQDRVGTMVFRIGNGMKMSGQSIRLPVEDFIPDFPV